MQVFALLYSSHSTGSTRLTVKNWKVGTANNCLMPDCTTFTINKSDRNFSAVETSCTTICHDDHVSVNLFNLLSTLCKSVWSSAEEDLRCVLVLQAKGQQLATSSCSGSDIYSAYISFPVKDKKDTTKNLFTTGASPC